MSDIRAVTPDFAVAPQLAPSDMAEAASRGFTLVINNRPDGEAPGQPTSLEMEQAARAAGMDYVHIPVIGGPTPDQVEQNRAAIESAGGPVLAFCRSGTRSIVTWSIGERLAGAQSRQDLIEQGSAAGYDLSGVLPA
ncbi:TIGR01244 family phosphatase [Caulobacter sp. SLTY]|uniref:TIGR01244 family sulfur transferase n=1 Tax=Caulobacter sp. SLTY TaxID=2683262 RepID=UPI0014123ACE|nr:TIGR01244 family sulfur transferase [Caulobacter sp. SLTY]NBB15244.1 TIGR01244 family phosphatase [Caulobacter sp. SLTY]